MENYRKHYCFWKFLHNRRVEDGSTKIEDAEAYMLKDSLMYIFLFRTGGFNKCFFNQNQGLAPDNQEV